LTKNTDKVVKLRP